VQVCCIGLVIMCSGCLFKLSKHSLMLHIMSVPYHMSCRDAAVLALNVQGSNTKALHWAKGVLSGGGCIADAAEECWMSMMEDVGISRYLVSHWCACTVRDRDH
jgi:hypothetical protein